MTFGSSYQEAKVKKVKSSRSQNSVVQSLNYCNTIMINNSAILWYRNH